MSLNVLVLGALVLILVVLLIIFIWYDRRTTERQRIFREEAHERAKERMEELTRELLNYEGGMDETLFDDKKRAR